MRKRILLSFVAVVAMIQAYGQHELPEMVAKLNAMPNDTSKVIQYGLISSEYRYKNPDSAFYYARTGFDLAVKLKFKDGIGRTLRQIGSLYDMHGDIDSAIKYLQEALYVFRSIHNTSGVAQTLNSLGATEGQRGNYDLATRYFLKALTLYKRDKNRKGTIDTYMKLGLASNLSGNSERAISYNNQAFAMLGKDSVSSTGMNVLNNMGTLYGKKHEYKTALGYLERGVSIGAQLPYSSIQTAMRTNIGNVYSKLGDKERARVNYVQSLKEATQYQLPVEKTHALVNLASICDSTDYAKALGYLEEALATVKAIKHDELLGSVYHSISQVYAEAGRYKEAYQSVISYHALIDTQLAVDRSKQIAELQANYDLEESKGKIQALELANQQRTFERNLGIMAAVGVGIIILIMCYYYLRIRKLNKKLEKSNRVKDRLFSVIGHDLRGPLGGLIQTLEILHEHDVDEKEAKEMIGELRTRSQAVSEMLDGMLLWGKAQLQGTDVKAVAFDPQPHIQKTIQALSKQARDKGITVNNAVTGDITLFADADHFEMAIRNLLSNAIKFSHELGTVDITAKARENAVVFSVADQGVGISEEAQRAFEHSSLQVTYGTQGEKGTGIGLRLVKDYIEANQGKIWMESKKGLGSTFYISLKGQTNN